MAQLIGRQLLGFTKTNTVSAISRTAIRTFATEADPEDYGYCKA